MLYISKTRLYIREVFLNSAAEKIDRVLDFNQLSFVRIFLLKIV